PGSAIVDAVKGDVLDVDAGISHAVGRVYPTDPRDPLAELELPRLLPGPPLRSTSFGINDVLYPPVVPVAPDDFRLVPEDSGFDQVNLYWHVDHYLHDFMAPLGYAGPPDSLIVRLHFALDPEVARTAGNFMTFGGGGASSSWGNSKILSSGLWDLRRQVGAASDSLVLESLAYLPTVPDW